MHRAVRLAIWLAPLTPRFALADACDVPRITGCYSEVTLSCPEGLEACETKVAMQVFDGESCTIRAASPETCAVTLSRYSSTATPIEIVHDDTDTSERTTSLTLQDLTLGCPSSDSAFVAVEGVAGATDQITLRNVRYACDEYAEALISARFSRGGAGAITLVDSVFVMDGAADGGVVQAADATLDVDRSLFVLGAGIDAPTHGGALLLEGGGGTWRNNVFVGLGDPGEVSLAYLDDELLGLTLDHNTFIGGPTAMAIDAGRAAGPLTLNGNVFSGFTLPLDAGIVTVDGAHNASELAAVSAIDVVAADLGLGGLAELAAEVGATPGAACAQDPDAQICLDLLEVWPAACSPLVGAGSGDAVDVLGFLGGGAELYIGNTPAWWADALELTPGDDEIPDVYQPTWACPETAEDGATCWRMGLDRDARCAAADPDACALEAELSGEETACEPETGDDTGAPADTGADGGGGGGEGGCGCGGGEKGALLGGLALLALGRRRFGPSSPSGAGLKVPRRRLP